MQFIDSSIWIAHFLEANEEASTTIEEKGILFTSILSLFEVHQKCRRDKRPEDKTNKTLEFMKRRAIIVNLDETIINQAVKYAIEKELHTVDALIYASAQSVNAELVTADNDFRGLSQTRVIPK